jgi:SpoVK/Ycf46/Vps4 family AAA+-type ATPase
MFAKTLAREFGMFMLTAEMAEMTGSLVGETEAKVRSFIEAAKAMAPCVVFIDEIEKGLAGLKGFGGYSGDSLNKKAMSQFLKFLQDRPKGIYVVATCNNISDLPPEYVRAERWDTAPFFIDLPSNEERETILKYYKGLYKVDGKLTVKDTEGWSGAELKAACRLAYLGNTTIDKSSRFIIPVSKTMEEDIGTLRKWAKGRTLPASEAAITSVGTGRDIELGDVIKAVESKTK